MKSKSFELKQLPTQKAKFNKTYDFISLYKPAAESSKLVETHKSPNVMDKENSFIKSKPDTPKFEKSLNKKKKNKQEPLDLSSINIEGPSLDTSVNKNTPLNESKVTSTPRNAKDQVKSIMKNSSVEDDSMDSSKKPVNKSKKRNKSVSFMLDDTEEVVVKKRTKSNDLLNIESKNKKGKLNKNNSLKSDIARKKKLKKEKNYVEKSEVSNNAEPNNIVIMQDNESSDQKENALKSKKNIKTKTQKRRNDTSSLNQIENNTNEDQTGSKMKKKKKHNTKNTQQNENQEMKTQKGDVKPEVIVENLENLSIGDNAHTISSLLDEMTVADKDKRKKIRHKLKKEKAQLNTSSSDNNDLEKNEAAKEKAKWQRRKWNRDKKGDIDDVNSVIVENLPLTIMCNYKKLLMDHFQQYGIIKRIGVAEVYPSKSDDNQSFGTTIVFYSDGAAAKALEADNTLFEGNHIHLMQKLPPTETTVVVRSYAALTDQNISTVFSEAGRIRNIRHLIKGKKSIETVFVEFDNPEAVAKAEVIAKETKIDGKRIHVNRYELRKKKKVISTNTEGEEGDSEASID